MCFQSGLGSSRTVVDNLAASKTAFEIGDSLKLRVLAASRRHVSSQWTSALAGSYNAGEWLPS